VLFRRSREGRAGALGRRHEGDGEKRRSRKKDGLKTKRPFTKNHSLNFRAQRANRLSTVGRELLTQLTRPILTQGGATGVGVRDACKLAHQLPRDGRERAAGGGGQQLV
jgi:hypothetical protein